MEKFIFIYQYRTRETLTIIPVNIIHELTFRDPQLVITTEIRKYELNMPRESGSDYEKDSMSELENKFFEFFEGTEKTLSLECELCHASKI